MVYFIREERDFTVKIGFTDQEVERRVSQIRSANPAPIVLLGFIEGGLKEEKQVHRIFDRFRLARNKEWFRYDCSMVYFLRLVGNCCFAKNKTEEEIRLESININAPSF